MNRRDLIGTALGAGAVLAGRRAAAMPANEAPLGRWFRARLAADGIPGGAAAIVRPGMPPLFLTAGHASLPFEVATSPETLFQMGSVGKHVTAVAVLRLAEAGKVDLTAGIGRYLPGLPASWQGAPVAAILSHTSGIPDWTDIVWDRPWPRSAVLDWAKGRPLDFAPGTAWRYSNAAFTLLGYLIEDVTGDTYAAHITAMLRDAGLHDARADDGEAVIAGRAEPYTSEAGVIRHATAMSTSISSVAAGGVLMSARDVPLWASALWGGKLLSPASLARMRIPVTLTSGRPSFYNMGWFIDALPGGFSYLWHTGAVSGFRCCHYHAPASGVTMMMFLNVDSDAIGSIGFELIEAFAPGTTPAGLPAIADRRPDWTRTFRRLMTREQSVDPALFTPEMRVLVERLGEDALDSYRDDQPPLAAVDLVQEDRRGNDVRRRYRLTIGNRHDFVTVGYAPNGLIYEVMAL